jgi:hypothetical protein
MSLTERGGVENTHMSLKDFNRTVTNYTFYKMRRPINHPKPTLFLYE